MTNQKPKTNPLDRDDSLRSFFENDPSYNTAKKNQYQYFKHFFNQKNSQSKPINFMSRILKTISTHSTAFIIGLVIAGSAVGASAAQLTAPDQYKPSTIFNELFKSNKQADKNPYTALKPDENNDVVKIDECDLAIKYPKMLKDVKVDSFELDSEIKYDKTKFGVTLENLPDLNKPFEQQRSLNRFSINCSDTKSVYPENEFTFDIVKPEVIQKLTGWFITIESKVGVIRTPKLNPDEKIPSTFFYFDFNNKHYEIEVVTEDIIKSQGFDKNYTDSMLSAEGIYADQVQIQFNSLVKNEANTKPKPAIKPIKNDGKQAIDIKLKDESTLIKNVNDIASLKPDGPDSILCGVPNAITYSEKSRDKFDNNANLMIIGNKKDYINDKYLNNNFNRVLTYLSNPNDNLTDTVTEAFSVSCGGGLYSNMYKT